MFWRDEDILARLVALVQRYRNQSKRIIGIGCEQAGAGMKGIWRTSLLNRFNDKGEPCPVVHEFNRSSMNKTDRISAITERWVDGHVKVLKTDNGENGYLRLFGQMERIGEMQAIRAAGKRYSKKDDWLDAMADALAQPVFYQPMRRVQPQQPWGPGSTLLDTPGLNTEGWDSDEYRHWMATNPRPRSDRVPEIKQITKCRACDNPDLRLTLNLGDQYVSNFVKERNDLLPKAPWSW